MMWDSVRDFFVKEKLEEAMHHLTLAQSKLDQAMDAQGDTAPEGMPSEYYNLPIWAKRAYEECDKSIYDTENAIKCIELIRKSHESSKG